MKKGDLVEGTIETLSFPSKGSMTVTEENPETGIKRSFHVTVKGKEVLPGAVVQARIKRRREDRAEGILMKIVKESPLESRMPLCHHFYECGGCTYQTVAYTDQLKIKEGQVKELLSPYLSRENEGGKLPQWEGILPAPNPFHYKNKMEFTFGDEEQYGPLTLGLHRQNSMHDILAIDSCAIVRPAWNAILKYTQAYFRKRKVPFYHKMQHYGILRNLVIRQASADGGILINLVTTTRENLDVPAKESGVNEALAMMDLKSWVQGLVELFQSEEILSLEGYNHLAGILYTENDHLADAIIPDRVVRLYGDDFLMEKVLGLQFRISPFSFFQTNTRGAEILYGKVREYVLSAMGLTDTEDEEKIREDYRISTRDEDLDIALDDIRHQTKEEVLKAVAAVTSGEEQKNAQKDKPDKLADVAGMPAEKAGTILDLYSGTGTITQLMAPIARKAIGIEIVPEAVESARVNARINRLSNCEFICGDVLQKLDELTERPDFIILDPPRDGVNPKALRKILAFGVENLVYISCKPTSLARDLAAFYEAGYHIVKGCCIDNFSQTCHVETVVLLGWKG